ncbi:MAG: PIG-L family deacetylase, partial [Candidatus Omnitrophica bacterium]|nr:PIG-L family deacetylase [Candidatus Omnitrophota bacterium]
ERYRIKYESEASRTSNSPYKNSYKRAKDGYTKENLVSDIKDIIKEYRPSIIYAPHPLDDHPDHTASTNFLNLALEELKHKHENGWVDDIKILYYFVHRSCRDSSCSYIFSQEPNYKEDIADFTKQKQKALEQYYLQADVESEREFYEGFIQEDELFWQIASRPQSYLKQVEEEWANISRIMKIQGHNVNFAPVIDVAEDINDVDMPLIKKRRIYSQDPQIVYELASAAIRGMSNQGIIPVVKHFPGLGRIPHDTHVWLPEIDVSKKELLHKDLKPLQELIKDGSNFWVMIDHAIYPRLSSDLASLSYPIQTEFLRNELGFKGIIIVDELLVMQAIREYAFRQKIAQPYIGEITARAFKAGADIALFYVESPEHASEIIASIIEEVKQSVKDGTIREQDIDLSVKRILEEKEKIFGVSLTHFLDSMSLEEKITQKLMTDVYCRNDDELESWLKLISAYSIAGIHARDNRYIDNFQQHSRIPLFISCQHEGGLVNQYGLNIYTRSAYLMGKEYERLLAKFKEGSSQINFGGKSSTVRLSEEEPDDSIACEELDELTRQGMIISLAESMQEVASLFSKLKETGFVSPNPSSLSPLIIYSNARLEIKPFEDLPIEWLRRFPNQALSLCAYRLFKGIFQDWIQGRRVSSPKIGVLTAELESLQKAVEEKIDTRVSNSMVRILCLATHPDDEDAEALTYFDRKFNCPTYILLATRGEAGENQVNASLYKELGALRIEEIYRAASVLGVDRVYYLGKEDFGYSYGSEEAFCKWDREDVLKRLVYFYRLIKPHIIISKHNSSDLNSHGQHQAFIVLAEEAFDLAGDSKAYPDIIEQGLDAWQPLKFYQRAFSSKIENKETVEIDTQQAVAPENMPIYKIAGQALRQHRSQGDWEWLKTGEQGRVNYELVKSRLSFQGKDSFLDGFRPEAASFMTKFEIPVSKPSGFPGVNIVSGLRIGLFETNDNALLNALMALGCNFQKLDEEFLKKEDLSSFNTIVLGKAEIASDVLALVENRLLEFVKSGGNLVIFAIPYIRKPIFCSPYTLRMSFNPIVDENSPMEIIAPEHSLFNSPNKVTSDDFTGWIQERGLTFPYKYSDKYTELLSCSSVQSGQIRGGYLVAEYGRGNYIFTVYSWHRQLREFHIGAYKNLANMLACTYIQNLKGAAE